MIDFRNPAHVKRLLIAIVAIALIVIVAVKYISVGEGDTDALKNGDVGEVSPSTEPVVAESGGISDAAVGDSGGIASVPITGDLYVDVGGEVNQAKVMKLPPGSRVNDAIEAAGGLTKEADISYINRAAALTDGDRVYIPSKREVKSGKPLPTSAGLIATDGASASGEPGGNTGSGAAQAGASADGKININTADATTLQILNGVGPATAEKIIDYRTQHGNFKKIEDIKNVSGIGEKTYEKLKDKITV